jgi:hypothetical protein
MDIPRFEDQNQSDSQEETFILEQTDSASEIYDYQDYSAGSLSWFGKVALVAIVALFAGWAVYVTVSLDQEKTRTDQWRETAITQNKLAVSWEAEARQLEKSVTETKMDLKASEADVDQLAERQRQLANQKAKLGDQSAFLAEQAAQLKADQESLAAEKNTLLELSRQLILCQNSTAQGNPDDISCQQANDLIEKYNAG